MIQLFHFKPGVKIVDNLVSFLEEIKLDFDWALYSCKYTDEYDELQSVFFPFCCQLSAQLVASFLAAQGYDARCIFATPPNHYWCECDGLIIDFTDFQFELVSCAQEMEMFHNHSLDREEFDLLVGQYPILYDANPSGNNPHTHRIMGFASFENEALQLVNEAKSYGFSKQEFIRFVSDYAHLLHHKLNSR